MDRAHCAILIASGAACRPATKLASQRWPTAFASSPCAGGATVVRLDRWGWRLVSLVERSIASIRRSIRGSFLPFMDLSFLCSGSQSPLLRGRAQTTPAGCREPSPRGAGGAGGDDSLSLEPLRGSLHDRSSAGEWAARLPWRAKSPLQKPHPPPGGSPPRLRTGGGSFSISASATAP